MKLIKYKLDPVNYQNSSDYDNFNEKLKGATRVETYTESAIGRGEAKTLVVFAFYPDDKEVEDSHTLEYWKKRCELAESYLREKQCDPDTKSGQIKAFNEWIEFRTSAKAGIEPERNFLSFGINEIKALDAYITTMRTVMSRVGELTKGRSEDFDILFMHINNLKILAGITEGITDSEDTLVKMGGLPPTAFGAMIIPDPYHGNFRVKYPLNPNKEE
ncbi:MAG: hypothetical protein PHT07_23840 [Paludibacter sp.]|nr:hypothetical protein [Paludibacter sp.]